MCRNRVNVTRNISTLTAPVFSAPMCWQGCHEVPVPSGFALGSRQGRHSPRLWPWDSLHPPTSVLTHRIDLECSRLSHTSKPLLVLSPSPAPSLLAPYSPTHTKWGSPPAHSVLSSPQVLLESVEILITVSFARVLSQGSVIMAEKLLGSRVTADDKAPGVVLEHTTPFASRRHCPKG